MNEIIANLLIENLYQEIKITALAKLLFENNIIKQDIAWRYISRIISKYLKWFYGWLNN